MTSTAATGNTRGLTILRRRLFASGMLVAAGAACTQVVAAVKDMFVAHRFGTSDGVDAYLIALLLPSFAASAIAGSFPAAVIPTFVDVRNRQGHDAAQRLLSNVVAWSMLLLIGAALLVVIAFPLLIQLLGQSFDPPKIALTRSLLYVLLPILMLNGLAVVWASVLNAERRFTETAFGPLAVPVAVLALVVLAGQSVGVYSLAWGFVAGSFVYAVCMGAVLRRHGYSLIPAYRHATAETRTVLNQYAPMVAGSMLMGGTIIVDQTMAAMLAPGSVATFGYALKVPAAAAAIGVLAIGTVMLPHFSHLVSSGQPAALRADLVRYVRTAGFWSVGATILLIVFSRPIVDLLYHRGAFTADDAFRVSRAQAILALHVPPLIVGTFYVRMVSALKRNDILWRGTLITFPLNAVLNYVLMQKWGINGIAASTAITYLASLAYLHTRLFEVLDHGSRGDGNHLAIVDTPIHSAEHGG